MTKLSDGEANQAALPDHLVTDGFDPVIGMSLSGDALADWLAARILEIERNNGPLPSIAILVNKEERLSDIADALSVRLESQNVRCVACPNGQVRGQDSDVRVFGVQHIKGLEFEAVFFVDVDHVACELDELFYREGGPFTPRAATYLGITCSSTNLPPQLEPMANAFKLTWSARA